MLSKVFALLRSVLNERPPDVQHPKNIRNPLIFLRKMATFSCFAGPKVMHFHVNMKCMTFCPWYQIILLYFFLYLFSTMFSKINFDESDNIRIMTIIHCCAICSTTKCLVSIVLCYLVYNNSQAYLEFYL